MCCKHTCLMPCSFQHIPIATIGLTVTALLHVVPFPGPAAEHADASDTTPPQSWWEMEYGDESGACPASNPYVAELTRLLWQSGIAVPVATNASPQAGSAADYPFVQFLCADVFAQPHGICHLLTKALQTGGGAVHVEGRATCATVLSATCSHALARLPSCFIYFTSWLVYVANSDGRALFRVCLCAV